MKNVRIFTLAALGLMVLSPDLRAGENEVPLKPVIETFMVSSGRFGSSWRTRERACRYAKSDARFRAPARCVWGRTKEERKWRHKAKKKRGKVIEYKDKSKRPETCFNYRQTRSGKWKCDAKVQVRCKSLVEIIPPKAKFSPAKALRRQIRQLQKELHESCVRDTTQEECKDLKKGSASGVAGGSHG